MPPRSRTKPGSTNRRPKVAGLRQHAHAGAAGPGLDSTDTTDAPEAPEDLAALTRTPEAPEAPAEPSDTSATREGTASSVGAPTTEVPAAPSTTTAGAPDGPATDEPVTDGPRDEARTDTAPETTVLPADESSAAGTVSAPETAESAESGTTEDTSASEDPGATTAATGTAAATTATRPGRARGARMAPRAGTTTTERPGRTDDAATASPTRTARPSRTGGRTAAAEESAWSRRLARVRAGLGRFAESRALPITLVVVVVVCLVLAGLAFWQGRKAWDDGPVANQAVVDVGGTAELVGQSRESIEKIFSYDFTKLDDSANAARTMSTAPFTDRYLSVFDQTIRQPAQQQQLRQTATVVNIGVVSMRGDHATVMALTQFSAQRTTTGQSTNAPGLLRLEMQRTDGRWKLSDLAPLTANR